MVVEQNLCVQCYDTITNPVCEECHMKHVARWLKDSPLDIKEKRELMCEIKASLPQEAMNENICILCGKNTLSVCSYCFFLDAARVIKKRINSKIALQSFLAMFDYQKGHDSYEL